METRTKLVIVLCGIIALVVLVLGILIYVLVRPSDTIAPQNRVEEKQTEIVERKNPWANQGEAVITLVKSLRSTPPLFPPTKDDNSRRAKKKDGEEEQEDERPLSYGEIMKNQKFIRDVLHAQGKEKGWYSEWWGKTDYGQFYYLVRYNFQDGDVTYGPEWLVDLKHRKVKPINLMAQIIENPTKGTESKYYNQEDKIISAIASHRFDNGMSLAGALLVYFEQQEGSDEENDIHGWTIVHVRGSLFRAYFQWTSKGSHQYAEFEYDFDDRKLKPVNFQAAEIMKVGEDFDRKRVDILPQSYDPDASSPAKRWIGPARKACAKPAFRENCDAFATMLDQKEIIESVEWLLTARVENSSDFDECQRLRNCAWKPNKKGPNDFTVNYEYKLDPKAKEPEKISWNVKPKEKEITANDAVSRLALKAIRPSH